MCECCCNATGPGGLVCTSNPLHEGLHRVALWDVNDPTAELIVEWNDSWRAILVADQN